ncbi:MAG: LamG-like jellyroll fold domain-containing protein, partial [Phycisphaerae bacterium]
MLVFRMDEENFAEGERDGARIVPGQGLKVDFDEFVADGSTLGLWHLHDAACQDEGTGLEDASGGGHDLTNHGAEAVEDGYCFVAGDSDYLDGALAGQPERSLLTLECWVRDWQLADGVLGGMVEWRRDGNNCCQLSAKTGAGSLIRMVWRAQGTTYYTVWTSADVDALLKAPEPWHVAGVVDVAAGVGRLFVNGVLCATSAPAKALLAGDYSLYVGYAPQHEAYLSGVVDEVRLSAVARYAANFTPHRLLAAGTYESPTFDAVRVQADWLDLVSEEDVPGGCEIGWEVRAADEVDGFGQPQALWQAYAGAPGSLPDGRYFQWRATLGTSADRFTSPTLMALEAQASEAGYDLYAGAGAGPETIDYAAPLARVGPSVREVQTDPLAAATVHWFGLRPVDVRGLESPVTQSEARLELDGAGAAVADRPAGALDVAADPLPLGAVRLEWQYRAGLTG